MRRSETRLDTSAGSNILTPVVSGAIHTRVSPFGECRRGASDVVRLVSLFYSAGAEQTPEWRPATDVYRTPDGWLVKFELAGVSPEDVELTARGRALRIRGRDEITATSPDAANCTWKLPTAGSSARSNCLATCRGVKSIPNSATACCWSASNGRRPRDAGSSRRASSRESGR